MNSYPDRRALQWPARAWEVPLLISAALAEEIRTGPQDVVDRVLLPVTDSLKRAYARIGNPRAVLSASVGVVEAPAIAKRLHRGSLQLARLHHFVAELHLATGPRGARGAMRHAQAAIEEVGYAPAVTEGVRQTFVDSALAWGVAEKIIGATDESHRILRDAIDTVKRDYGGNSVDVVPLIRQELMMQQTLRAHESLAAQAPEYAQARPREYYRTVKRILEYLLNHDYLREAEQVLPEFKRAFRVVAAGSSPISHISFLKNVGHYYAKSKSVRDAGPILLRAYAAALSLGLQGQLTQIGVLLEGTEGCGKDLRLVTAKVNMGR